MDQMKKTDNQIVALVFIETVSNDNNQWKIPLV